jgi:hypothetical protein
VLLQDKVLEVQPEQLLNDGGSATGGSVRLASGGTIEYDWLVVSLGAAADPRGVPGVREHARPFVSLEDAEYVAQQMAVYEARAAMGQPRATVAVVGAGYAGVELAAVVGERLKGKARVVLLTPGADILEAAPAGQREAAVQVRGVWLCVALQRCRFRSAAVCNGSRSNCSCVPDHAVDVAGQICVLNPVQRAAAAVVSGVACQPVRAQREEHHNTHCY